MFASQSMQFGLHINIEKKTQKPFVYVTIIVFNLIHTTLPKLCQRIYELFKLFLNLCPFITTTLILDIVPHDNEAIKPQK